MWIDFLEFVFVFQGLCSGCDRWLEIRLGGISGFLNGFDDELRLAMTYARLKPPFLTWGVTRAARDPCLKWTWKSAGELIDMVEAIEGVIM